MADRHNAKFWYQQGPNENVLGKLSTIPPDLKVLYNMDFNMHIVKTNALKNLLLYWLGKTIFFIISWF